jgi:hypothetical protein
MIKKLTALTAMSLTMGTMAFSNTPLLVNTDFATWDDWRAGTNHFFSGWSWRFWDEAPDYYAYEDRVTPGVSGSTFISYDDEVAAETDERLAGTPSDWLYTSLFQEFPASPPDGAFPTQFETGDVIVFKGFAQANRLVDANNDMEMKAFIKVLGWVNGIDFQETEWTVKTDISGTLSDFEITTTMPDVAVNDNLLVVQIGFEINTFWDDGAGAMDSGTIYFENIEAYVVGEAAPQWNGFDVDENGWADTGAWMGMVNVAADPWIWSNDLTKYLYIPTEGTGNDGAWVYALSQ